MILTAFRDEEKRIQNNILKGRGRENGEKFILLGQS
jgi:hypothetical protein